MSCKSNSAEDSETNWDYFTDVSKEYEQYRPSYPQAAIVHMLSGLKSPNLLLAADIGAGTGIGSRLLAEKGLRVWAIEPNTQMQLSATTHANVEFITGTAEDIPLETGSVDLVVCFQAFHWFDFIKSLHEFHRVLKPQGRLALIWNFWNQEDEISQHYTQLVNAASSKQIAAKNHFSIDKLIKTLHYQIFWQGLWLPYFKNLSRHHYRYEQHLDLSGLIGLAKSQGFVERDENKLEHLINGLTALSDRFAQEQGLVRLVYNTHLYLADKTE